MYFYDKKLKAVTLYFKYESYAAVINELGYPSRIALRNWVEDHRRDGDVKKEIIRQPKYTEEQKQAAVAHYLEYGKCYSRTCRMLGYPSRGLLTQWVMELTPQTRKFKKNGVNLTQQEKEAAVLTLLTRDRSAQLIADEIGVSRASLYHYKEQLLGRGVSMSRPEKSKDTDVNKLKDQVKQLQDEIYHLQMQKGILEKAGELIKKAQGIFLEEMTNREKTILIDALRPTYKLSELLKSIDMPKSSYGYHKKQLALPDKYGNERSV